MAKEKEKGEGYYYWWAIIITMLVMLIFTGYSYWSANTSLNNCLSGFKDTLSQKNAIATNLSVCEALVPNSNIDAILSRNNLFKFCQSKGFESGGLSTYSCDGVLCLKSQVSNGTQTTVSGCYKISEMINYVR